MGKEAREFSTSTNYVIGDLTLYGGYLYRFTSNHSAGAWNSAHVVEVDHQVEPKLTRLLAAYDNAEEAAEYGESFVFTPQQINGTRYKYILTNGPDPRK
jgi:hypothetical protein